MSDKKISDNNKKDFRNISESLYFCRGEKTRTSDLLHPMQARFQLRHTPKYLSSKKDDYFILKNYIKVRTRTADLPDTWCRDTLPTAPHPENFCKFNFFFQIPSNTPKILFPLTFFAYIMGKNN